MFGDYVVNGNDDVLHEYDNDDGVYDVHGVYDNDDDNDDDDGYDDES